MSRHRQPRTAFTLIELLVVIAIIAILAALVVAAVMGVFSTAKPAAETTHEISEMSNALATLKAKYQLSQYPLGKIKLYPNRASYSAGNQLDVDSLSFLNKMWPSLGNFAGVDWSGIGAAVPAGGWILEGDQTLVFWLSGIQGQGFSTNPKNPAALGGDRVSFFEFKKNRLYSRVPGPFLSYKDAYENPKQWSPYVYFAPLIRTRSYDPNPTAGAVPPNYSVLIPALNIGPYYRAGTNPKQYYAPNSFQIISAGRDKAFGPGVPAWDGACNKGAAFDDHETFEID